MSPLSDFIAAFRGNESLIKELYGGCCRVSVVVVVPDNGIPVYPIWVLYIFVFASMGFIIISLFPMS